MAWLETKGGDFSIRFRFSGAKPFLCLKTTDRKEAEAALGDPAQAAVPILTIALDAGFGSIGPFNRAFKAHTGVTPSEYRRARAAGATGAET